MQLDVYPRGRSAAAHRTGTRHIPDLRLEAGAGLEETLELPAAEIVEYRDATFGELAFVVCDAGEDRYYVSYARFRDLPRGMMLVGDRAVSADDPDRVHRLGERTLLVARGVLTLEPLAVARLEAGDILLAPDGDFADGERLTIHASDLYLIGSEQLLHVSPDPTDRVRALEGSALSEEMAEALEQVEPDHVLLVS